MNSNLDPLFYYDLDLYKNEQNVIFKKVWHFVGFKFDLLNVNDYITIKINDTPIVIQNLKGEIKAFLNVCSHRFAILQTEKSGNRPLMCNYHGWSYDKDGIPSGIPKKPLFKQFSHDELCEMKLKEFKIDFCGNLVFVCISENAESLKEFLGDFYNELKLISFSIGEKIDINSFEINCNWKIVIENTLESYHVALVHANTLAKLKPSGLNFYFHNLNSSWETTLNISKIEGGYKKINNYFSPRKYDIEGYKHILVFPNLLISSTHGISYNFSLIEPLKVDKTKFTSYVFTSEKIGEIHSKPIIIKAFEESLVSFNRQVFEEDKFVCQLVQEGVVNTSLLGKLSEEEERVHHFQKNYLNYLHNDG
jgi:phenylpropionate dioxygenase-like ring-hydroxylating dioxygenase large terminal subunit